MQKNFNLADYKDPEDFLQKTKMTPRAASDYLAEEIRKALEKIGKK